VDNDVIATLVRLIEVKDHSTAAHTWRVALYARALADRAGLDHPTIERITRGAALHDYGKIEIPDAILQKPGALTDEERLIIQSHPELGHQRLIEMGETDEIVLELVRHHHERPDGLGYPDRLSGDAIPLVARFFAVIDSFDAMTSVRPYRQTVGDAAAERAMTELRAGAGTRYDSDAVAMFGELYAGGSLDWILHYYNDECPVMVFDHREAATRPAAPKPEIVVVKRAGAVQTPRAAE
jgi:putative nucleotidyltransferase with HDIG domain